MSHNSVRPWRNIDRRISRRIMVGNVPVGGDAPISVQTMTNTVTTDVAATVDQVQRCAEAGADMVLSPSKQPTPDEIESFVRAGSGDTPIVIAPTAYPQMTEARALALGKVKILNYGNHSVRASVAAMQRVFAQIISDGGIHQADEEIVPVSELFRLQGMHAVNDNEKRFLCERTDDLSLRCCPAHPGRKTACGSRRPA